MDDMDELGELLAPILQDPDTIEKLRQQAEQLGLGDMLSGARQEAESEKRNDGSRREAASGTSGDMADMLAKLMPLLAGLNAEDDSARLLGALRPFLSEKRGRRLDEAGKLLSAMRVIRLLSEIKQ